MLRGVCALRVDVDADSIMIDNLLDDIRMYHSHKTMLIGSLWIEYGSDNNEIIMRGNETVLAVW